MEGTNQFNITFNGNQRKFEFRVKDEKEAKEWYECIKKHIEQSKGVKDGLKAPETDEFWKFKVISESQFIDIADTFDILLYHCNNTGATITRTYSNSKYDHVGMILRFESNPNEVYILEATGKLGVHLSKYSSVKKNLGPGKFYDKLVLRHLEFERTDDCLTKLEAFMKQVIGHSYSVGVSKLMRKKTVAMKG